MYDLSFIIFNIFVFLLLLVYIISLAKKNNIFYKNYFFYFILYYFILLTIYSLTQYIGDYHTSIIITCVGVILLLMIYLFYKKKIKILPVRINPVITIIYFMFIIIISIFDEEKHILTNYLMLLLYSNIVFVMYLKNPNK